MTGRLALVIGCCVALVTLGIAFGAAAVLLQIDRPAPLPPAPATPTLTDTCSQGKYRVWTNRNRRDSCLPRPDLRGHQMREESMAADRGKRRRSLDRLMMDVLGREWCGDAGPPAANRKMYLHDDGVYRVFSMQDDGGFVGIGYPDEWHVIMRTEAARWFAWWTLKVWVADWFGLRSKLWYMALHRRVKGEWKWTPYHHARTVWPSSYEAWREAHL